ncbi:TetR/AcrR family transcriptional regulator [Nocardioides marinquilinus]|uniref:TetR/AcrR family transcriptional regulator n=1 Tax=Nocardioides marinquilinus TaxID=1210400 RepID=A0ABP9PJ31_9ACTN
MARNETRRAELADAGIAVLAREGSRGLTHRAVDAESGSPAGTTSNYFRSRARLVEGLVERIGERLAPDPAVVERLTAQPADRDSFAAHLRDIVRRLTADRRVTLAWLELRLEAARRPEVAALMQQVLRSGLAADVAYHEAAGLPGGAREVALFHYAVDGLMLDRLTVPIDPGTTTDDVLDAFVEALIPLA